MKGLRNGSTEQSWEVHLRWGRGISFAGVEGKAVDSHVFGGWGADIKKTVIREVVWITPRESESGSCANKKQGV